MRSECAVLTADLFADVPDVRLPQQSMAEGALLLHGFATAIEADLIAALRDIVAQAPFRQQAPHVLQKTQAARILPLGIGVREMRANVAETRRAQKRVADSVC